MTSLSEWTVSEPHVLTVPVAGRARALTEGKTVLTARLGDRSARAQVQVEGSARQRSLSFAWDIEKILTRRGCNDSNCHGGVKGRGGFKLSLQGIYPEEDYRWIVRGGTYQVLSPDPGTEVSRINLEKPEKSLLLLKPTLGEPHQGGQQLPLESEDYQTLLQWVKRGAPFQEGAPPGSKVAAIEVFPTEVVLDVQGKQQLLVTAKLREWGSRRHHRPGTLPFQQHRGRRG